MIRIILSMLFITFNASAFANTKKFDEGMKPILKQYLKIQLALASDSTEGVKEAAGKIKILAKKLNPASVTGEHASHFKNIPKNLVNAATSIEKSKDIDSTREHFKKLSQPMAMWAGMSKPSGVDVAYCPMAKSSWLQEKGSIKNPYYGKKMLTCGEVVK